MNHVEANNAAMRRRNSAFRRRTNTYAGTVPGLRRTLDVILIQDVNQSASGLLTDKVQLSLTATSFEKQTTPRPTAPGPQKPARKTAPDSEQNA
ncbi:MAG: hypothetical protein D3914_09250 [Candidatus Electrothrix sp. LOE2]|nr:hypothetical protein [Candidatus Electrothrix sp. LOE2]